MNGRCQRDTIHIETDGRAVGQVNGLAVMQLGNYAFGKGSRITATARLGTGRLIDIEREAKLGGNIHSKAVMIIGNYIGRRYAADRPLSLHASLAFEQNYGGVEGDSASVAEVVPWLSAIADTALSQALAVTGSIDQHGRVQAVGGVNEKIEGFFETCERRGFAEGQGILMPRANVPHLMLRQSVRDAVAAGRFRIIPIDHVDQAIELLSGMPAGERGDDGNFPAGSFNAGVDNRLTELLQARMAVDRLGVSGNGDDKDGDAIAWVLVVLEERGEFILETAARVAAHEGLPLVGVVIEDRAALSSAELPFTREIGFTSGIARPLIATEVAAAMRERMERMHALLGRVAREHGLESAFRIGRGDRVEEVLRGIHPEDLFIIRHESRAGRVPIERVLSRAACAVMLIASAAAAGAVTGGAMVIVDDSSAAERALQRAVARARANAEPLAVVLLDGAPKRSRVQELMQDAGIEARLIELPHGTAGPLTRAIRGERPGMLFLGRDSRLLTAPSRPWQVLLQELPLVLVP
ncbi:MAG: S16 family serine protease [Halofilum sp. (in: g-proteobacteria)]|nr:S16 family serine protease [Halofilum sp. (in: g-proteobacteria)]